MPGRTSAHYTPPELAEPIVRQALAPLLGDQPASSQILRLAVCDPAMGAGVCLLAALQILSEALLAAWAREGALPGIAEAHGDPDLHARRLLARACLYGVDKDPGAVEQARRALWLAIGDPRLPRDALDHALVHGDALLGLTHEQLLRLDWDAKAALSDPGAAAVAATLARAAAARRRLLASEDPAQTSALRRQAEAAQERARVLADAVIAAYFAHDKDRPRRQALAATRVAAEAWLRQPEHTPPPPGLADPAAAIRATHQPLHWHLQFPELFVDEDRVIAFVGNPPFMGGKTIRGQLGPTMGQWCRRRFASISADYCAYFFLLAHALIRRGTIGFIATNTIAQGATRSAGLARMLAEGAMIYAAVPDQPWPGAAAVTVSIVHLAIGEVQRAVAGRVLLRGAPVAAIDSRLRPHPERPAAKALPGNRGLAHIGSYVLGTGFILGADEAEALCRANPRNREIIRPYLSGEDLNTSPTQSPSRHVINFRDLDQDRARAWPELFAIVEARVRPARERLADSPDGRRYKALWWQFGRRQDGAYRAIASRSRCLVTAVVSKHVMFSFAPCTITFAHKICIFADDRHACLAVLQSRVHERWARLHSSTMRDAGINYAPSDCAASFAFPDDEQLGPDSALEQIGAALDAARGQLMRATGSGLTTLYNRLKDPRVDDPRITALRELHLALDRAVLEAYGWSDLAVPAFTEPVSADERAAQQVFADAVIDRLFARNAALAG